jgi:hypothetical protein
MKYLSVPFVELSADLPVNNISIQLDKLEKHFLEFTPWAEYPYKPDVSFSIAHSNDHIFLKYDVKEKFIRAAAGEPNGPVWEDACVELFISFDEKGYYNLEFNCIGTCLIGFGKERSSRVRIAVEKIRKVKYGVSINNQHGDNIHWELTLAIPLEVFAHHDLTSLKGRACGANFYKCGDKLPQPHFVTWSNIEAPQPDFHLPEFFGEVVFE